ncbi:NAD(P)-dependent oxidoreductase [Halobacillus sp. A5]|uniref:NAD(P)-dependent oxidoreductase n=1 Tax=Halobacillus sp. A5 TaxID=2880263 RepID=UPI0020A6A8C5|nr:NAD(P)H-binding protein [Halobacillus sp. A5]MCP3026778.1 NAD(P)H-binding protein [Halobacillus sp. A5]
MKIAIFGGTGRVGSMVTNLCLKEGYEVYALVRSYEKAKSLIPGAHHINGEASDPVSIEKTLKDCDLVFSALNTDKTDTLSAATPLIIQGMLNHGINRIITIGTAGILNSRLEKGKYRFQSKESKRRSTFAAEEHEKAYQALNESTLDWVIICPTYLPEGGSEGGVRYEVNQLPEDGKRISVTDTAAFSLNVIKSGTFHQTRIGICY